MMQKLDIISLDLRQLTEQIKEMGLPAFRAKQVYQWIHQKQASAFAEMTNLSKDLQQQMAAQFSICDVQPVEILTSKIDGTKKFLFQLSDQNVIESVLMKYKHGNSVCISSQVGCRMGCKFCASTLDGLERNLTTSEMLAQVYQIQKATNERVSHVVVMGSGEPLDNFDNLVKFIRILTDENGLNISQRNITVSTCGLIPEIYRLADEKLQITLAISLHAPNDTVRETLMPIARKYTIDDILKACSHYFETTGRRLTFEYSLVSGVNDNQEEAHALIQRIKNQHGHVNLIPVNPIKERTYKQSDSKSIEKFRRTLEKHGIAVTVRREMGRDINGACGQLRKHYLENQERMNL